MSSRIEIERDSLGFVARVEHADGRIDSMSDGGKARSLESFFPIAAAWLEKNGIPTVRMLPREGDRDTVRLIALLEKVG